MVRKNSYIYLRKRWYDIISESGKDYLYFGIKKTRILMICVSFVLSRKYNDLKKGKAFHNPQFFVAYNLCNPMFGEAFPSFRICSLIVNSFALVEVKQRSTKSIVITS